MTLLWENTRGVNHNNSNDSDDENNNNNDDNDKTKTIAGKESETD